MNLRVAAFTGGRDVPSARFRVRQLIPALRYEGIDLREFPARLGAYPPHQTLARPLWAIATLTARIPGIAASFRYDVTLLQREFLSTAYTLEGCTKRPRVLDVDDAIWLYRGGAFARRLAQQCERVICGNRFLAAQFHEWNPSVTVIPTAVDTMRFHPASRDGGRERRPIIVWMGASGGFADLALAEQPLAAVLRRHPDAVIRVVAECPPALGSLHRSQVEYVPWSPDTEVRAVQEASIGIMPLLDTEWNRGKCAYKALIYMACGLPVVMSPIGMNQELLELGECGLGPRSNREWVTVLGDLLSDPAECTRMGCVGRGVADDHFSVRMTVPRVAAELRTVANRR